MECYCVWNRSSRKFLPVELKRGSLVSVRRELVDFKMPQPLSSEELEGLTPESLMRWYGDAIISISELVDSLDHQITARGTKEIQDLTFDARASVPGHPFWHERTKSGKIW